MRLIRRRIPASAEELYDIVADPYERVNLVDKLPEVRAELAAYLEAWQRETQDPLLLGPIPDKLNGWPDKEVN